MISDRRTTQSLDLRPCTREDLPVLLRLWTDPAVRFRGLTA
jgi:hypothetical protein